jgi:hypothetical protein
VWVAGPVLLKLGVEVEAHDEGLVAGVVDGVLGDEIGDVTRGEGVLHGVALVEEDGDAQRKARVVDEEGDARGRMTVVAEAEVGGGEVGDGAAMFIFGVEGESNLVGVYVKDVGLLGTEGGGDEQDAKERNPARGGHFHWTEEMSNGYGVGTV